MGALGKSPFPGRGSPGNLLAFPGVSTYGGGPEAVVEWPLGPVFAVNGTVAGEFYPVGGGVIVALLGGAGVAAHF